jgi:hypothetical protein
MHIGWDEMRAIALLFRWFDIPYKSANNGDTSNTSALLGIAPPAVMSPSDIDQLRLINNGHATSEHRGTLAESTEIRSDEGNTHTLQL